MKTKLPIDMMSATALANYVVANMGLDVKPQMGLNGIRAKMAQAGYPIDFIEIDDGEEERPIARVEPPRERHIEAKRSVQIRIEPQERPGGNEPVYVSVNGSNILIPRSLTCWVDYKYYHALQNAVAKIAEVDQDSNITSWRSVPEYPVSVFHVEPPLTAEEKKRAVEIASEEQERAAVRRAAAQEDAA